jgi:hypothetical protein
MVLYGPPGSGKTTIARIVATAARAAFEERVRREGDGWTILPGPVAGWMHYVERGEMTEAEHRLVHAKLRPMPLKALRDPVRRTSAAAAVPTTFIYCTLNGPPGDASDVRRAREAGCRYREVRAAHAALLTHPREVADLLAEPP